MEEISRQPSIHFMTLFNLTGWGERVLLLEVELRRQQMRGRLWRSWQNSVGSCPSTTTTPLASSVIT